MNLRDKGTPFSFHWTKKLSIVKTHISETCQKKEQNKLSREATDERADAQRRFERDRNKIKLPAIWMKIKDRNSSLKILD